MLQRLVLKNKPGELRSSETENPFGRRGSVQRSPPTLVRTESCSEALDTDPTLAKMTGDDNCLVSADAEGGDMPVGTSGTPAGVSEGAKMDMLERRSKNAEKRRRVRSSSESSPEKREAVSTEVSAAADMHNLKLRLDEILADPSAKFNKSAAQKVTALFSEASRLLMVLGCENSLLRGRLVERTSVQSVKVQAPKETFAEVARRGGVPKQKALPVSEPRRGPRNGAEQRNCALIISGNQDKATSAESVKKAILEAIDPVADQIRIRNVRKIGGDRVVVQAHSKVDLEKIVANGRIKDKGLKISLPVARRPRIIIYDVPRAMEPQEVKNAIRRQNDIFQGMSSEAFDGGCVLRFRNGKRNEDTVNWVTEVAPEVRARLLKAGRI